jgi:hypothetical protein
VCGDADMYRPACHSLDNFEESFSRIRIIGVLAGPLPFNDAKAQSHVHSAIGIDEASGATALATYIRGSGKSELLARSSCGFGEITSNSTEPISCALRIALRRLDRRLELNFVSGSVQEASRGIQG